MPEFELLTQSCINNIGFVRIFSHKSGARVVSIDNDDNNLVFSLCFDTPALDDTGIPHILEHCVLCGSESYPFKDAFNFLENNTLHSYLNAITYPDKTLYPVASTDEGSLMLMARVYCDAVFHPLVYKNKGIFLQEGGFFDGKKINGSVYGEISGFYDIPENNAEQRLKKSFTPFMSAGVPEDIPNASYTALLDYHQKYYIPANCTAFIYGSCNKEKYFQLLDDTFNTTPNGERPALQKNAPPNKIFADTSKKTALIPVSKTLDHLETYSGDIVCDVLKKYGINAEFNRDGDIAYIKINAGNIEEAIEKYRGKINSFDLTKPYFYFKSGDFGYKPRGLYYNIMLMRSGYDPDCLDIEGIFYKLWEEKPYEKLADEIFKRSIVYTDISKPKSREYPRTDPAPLYEYRAKKDSISDIFIPFPKIPRENIVFENNAAFTDNKNRDIINITLAFVLDLPQDMLIGAVSLLKMRQTSLPLDEREFADIGKPVFLMHLGFFAENAGYAANEINKIFGADAPLSLPFAAPELLTKLSALAAAEKSSFILDQIYCGIETNDVSDIQKALFTKENLYCAVCTDSSNFDTARKIISSLVLYPYKAYETPTFIPKCYEKEVNTDNSVNTISLCFTSPAGYAEKYAAAAFLQNTYLWDNIRCKGAYGCDIGVTPNGSIYMTSFKDINYESSIKTMKAAFSHLQSQSIDMYRLKLMCLNDILKPKTPKNANIYALKRLFGARDITAGILSLTEEKIQSAAGCTKFIALSSRKAKN